MVALLLCFVMPASGAFPIFYGCFNNSKRTGSSCIFETTDYLFGLLAIGLWSCTLLYFASGFFERGLANREICWKYFCAKLRDELSRGSAPSEELI
jgi:hypothetical protein